MTERGGSKETRRSGQSKAAEENQDQNPVTNHSLESRFSETIGFTFFGTHFFFPFLLSPPSRTQEHTTTMGQSSSKPPPPTFVIGVQNGVAWLHASAVSVTGRKGSSASTSSKMIKWTRKNPGKAFLGTLILSAAMVVVINAYRNRKARHRHLRKPKVVCGVDGSKREVVGK